MSTIAGDCAPIAEGGLKPPFESPHVDFPDYHPAAKDGILNSWGIFYAIRWHNLFEIPPWNILCHPLGETCLP